jgi:hypothetical protein
VFWTIEQVHPSDEGTPQGGSISVLLSNPTALSKIAHERIVSANKDEMLNVNGLPSRRKARSRENGREIAEMSEASASENGVRTFGKREPG